MKVSVIIPTHEPKSYLWECLDSLTVQTFPMNDFEIILVLNGCRDPYEKQIRKYIKEHPKIPLHLIHTDQKGVSHARNIALDAAQGEYITFIDDDDYVSPCYLEELYAKASPDTIALCYPYAFNDGDVTTQLPYSITEVYERRAPHGRQCYQNARKYFQGPCMKLIHRDCIRDRRFHIHYKNGEDSLFMFLISDSFLDIDFTPHHAIYYRRRRTNSANWSRKTFSEQCLNSASLMGEYSKIFFQGGYQPAFYATRMAAAVKKILLAIIGK